MAETKQVSEREYIVPLRREWTKVPRYERAGKSVKAVKKFIARHMKVQERDLSKVKISAELNEELWFRGAKKAYSKIKVKARKEGENVIVELVAVPNEIKFRKAKQSKKHIKTDKKKIEKVEEKTEQTEEEKTKEQEKEKSVEQLNEKVLEKQAKAQKHTVGKGKEVQIQRKALKK